MTSFVIAIDGPAASGKSTIAKIIADRLKSIYISTGDMFRAVAWSALEKNLDLDKAEETDLDDILNSLKLDYLKTEDGMILTIDSIAVGQEIRTPKVSKSASKVAVFPNVRKWLLKKQRELAETETVVMEGRDIGTVVFPDAKFKFFLTATPEVRALRRLKQDTGFPNDTTVASVAKEIAARDEADSKRKIAPLKKADDATLIDSSEMTIEEVVGFIVSHVKYHLQ